MIGLFSFDGPMYKDINGIYCNTTLTNEMFSRYFEVVDELVVLIRTLPLDKTYIEANMQKVDLNNMKIIEIPNLNTVKGFLIERNEYSKIIEQYVGKSDLIFARMPSIISDLTIKYSLKQKKKYFVEVGGCAWDAHWNHGLLGKIIAPYVYLKAKSGIKKSDYASYVTEKWLQKRYPSNGINTFASNVYLNKVDNHVLQSRLKKINDVDCKKLKIGTTAAVNVKYKGQEYIIEAISILNKCGYDFTYELVGGGSPDYLKKIAHKFGVEDKVTFKGLLSKNEVINWLDTIDLYAQPSKQEGLPRALIEALSRGCPAIGSNTAGIPELLENSVRFNKGDVNVICEILKKMDNPSLSNNAIINFNKSKEFELENLNFKRNRIYKKYKQAVVSIKETYE
ncbi:glycosyltransferase [Exiguobacterium sp. SL-9]|uniref:glycosyltransferase n=1 Tax=Exiguobacterium sp. SL-9 TaxID=2510963 RepID=UPI00103E3DB2|nr:glycosyltransferase [Exiguobacterium sp. SL-9]TCI21720.1 glycosyltransferase [Exiguobacterium sp. SL-9]